MKFLRYAFITIVLGALFGGAFMLGVRYMSQHLLEADGNALHEGVMAELEEKIGTTCLDVHADMLQFTEDVIAGIIDLGDRGEDWIAAISPNQKSKIDKLEGQLRWCTHAEISAEELGLNWPDFREPWELFSQLETWSTQWGDSPPSADMLSSDAFPSLKANFRNVTNH